MNNPDTGFLWHALCNVLDLDPYTTQAIDARRLEKGGVVIKTEARCRIEEPSPISQDCPERQYGGHELTARIESADPEGHVMRFECVHCRWIRRVRFPFSGGPGQPLQPEPGDVRRVGPG